MSGIIDTKLRPYPNYKDSDLGWARDIPQHWVVSNVKRQYDIQMGKMLQTEPKAPTDRMVQYLRAINVQWYSVNTENSQTMWANQGEIDQLQVKAGDLLVCEGGEGGRAGIVTSVPQGFIIQNALHRVRPKHYALNRFLQHLMKVIADTGWFDATNNKATIAHFTKEKFAAMRIPIPPIDEQAAIVRYLDYADELISRYISAKERLIALLEEQRQAVIHQAVTCGLDPDVQTKPGEIPWLENIPKHWDVRRLGQLATKFGSGVTPRGGAAVYRDTGVPFLRSQNVHFDGLRLDDVVRIPPNLHESMSASHVQPHDVLLNITGASIGRVCSVPHDLGQGNVNQHVCIIRPNQELLLSRFLVAFLSTSGAQNDIRTEQTGASREGLTLQSIRDFRTPLPPISEQTQIVHRIDEATHDVYRAIASTSRQIDLANEYRTRLIADFVTGQIDVRGAAIALPV